MNDDNEAEVTNEDIGNFFLCHMVRLTPTVLRLNTISASCVIAIIEALRSEAERIYHDMKARAVASGIKGYDANAQYYAHAIAFLDHAKMRSTGSFSESVLARAIKVAYLSLSKDTRHATIPVTVAGKGSRVKSISRRKRPQSIGSNPEASPPRDGEGFSGERSA